MTTALQCEKPTAVNHNEGKKLKPKQTKRQNKNKNTPKKTYLSLKHFTILDFRKHDYSFCYFCLPVLPICQNKDVLSLAKPQLQE